MPLINIVYPHTRRTGHTEYKGDFTVILSAYPVDDCDMYVYQDAFAYFGERPGIEVLLMLEPYVVLPREYSEDIWHYFDYVLTFVDGLAERGGKFRKINFPVFPVYDDRGTGALVDTSITTPLSERKNAICLINGNKSSPVEGELYSKRIEISKWFYSNSDIPFDVYGYPPFELPNYYGKVENKFKTLAQYKFSLCFENVYHPIWSRGYVSEKLLHSMVTETVPIYLGCYNIEDYVPTDCFIDFRQFDNYADLDRFLHGLSEKEYQTYVDNIRGWIRAGNLDDYSVHRLYDKLADLLEPGWAEAHHDQPWKYGLAPQYIGSKRRLITGKPVWSWQDLAPKQQNPVQSDHQRSAILHAVTPSKNLDKLKVIIIGVRSSGTKLLGTLVNELLKEYGVWPYHYEPLFWNSIHGENGIQFNPDGLRAHKEFPLLPDKNIKSWPWMDGFISSLWGLAKFIRAGSRVRLFYEKNIKLLWITRELYSWIASGQHAMRKYPQLRPPKRGWHYELQLAYDYKRLEAFYPQLSNLSKDEELIYPDVAWWHIHNIEPFKLMHTGKIFHVRYEDLCANPIEKMKEIAEFIQIPYKPTPTLQKVHPPPQRKVYLLPNMDAEINKIVGDLNQRLYPEFYQKNGETTGATWEITDSILSCITA